MRRGLTLIELIFTMVIVAVVFTVIPKLIQSFAQTGEVAIKEDALFNAVSRMALITSSPWDSRENPEYIRTVEDGDERFRCDSLTGYRKGGFVGGRRCDPDETLSYFWHVDFSGGSIGYSQEVQTMHVRCVRGTPLAKDETSFNRASDIVSDDITGLQWQDNDDNSSVDNNWTEAIDYCENLNLGGNGDWRLPNRRELISVVDWSQSTPALFADFENFSTNQYWTSTTYKADANTTFWQVNFIGGGSAIAPKDSNLSARCVRGPEAGASGPLLTKTGQTDSYYAGDDGDKQEGVDPDFVLNGIDVVADNITGLEWQNDSEVRFNDYNQSEAITYCENLNLGGNSDWRLPFINELETLINLGRVNPAIDPTFNNVSSGLYWSNTQRVGALVKEIDTKSIDDFDGDSVTTFIEECAPELYEMNATVTYVRDDNLSDDSVVGTSNSKRIGVKVYYDSGFSKGATGEIRCITELETFVHNIGLATINSRIW